MPKVSVLLPAYNTKAEYLREAVDSILAQTFTDFELLILDDCSTHPSVAEVVSSYSDGRIKFFRNDRNLGISGSRNKLIELAQGEYLANADHDDISLPNRLELQVNFMDSHPEVGVLGGTIIMFPKYARSTMPFENDDIENRTMFNISLNHQAAMIRKNVLDRTKVRYEEEFSPAEDHRLWTRLIGKTRFANLPDLLVRYRKHEENTSVRQLKQLVARGYMAATLARLEHPAIWGRAQRCLTSKTKYKLFGRITLLTIKKQHTTKQYFLFGHIPFLKCIRQIRFDE